MYQADTVVATDPASADADYDNGTALRGMPRYLPMPPQEELAALGSLEGLDDDRIELLRPRAVDHRPGVLSSGLSAFRAPAAEAVAATDATSGRRRLGRRHRCPLRFDTEGVMRPRLVEWARDKENE